MARLSLGRRMMIAASRAVPASDRWRLFRLPNGVRQIRDLDLAIYRQADEPPVSSLGNDKIDIVRDRIVFRVDNGFANHNGATLMADGALIRELSREWNVKADSHSKLRKPVLMPKIHRVPKAAGITIEHNTNYCHFFYDCIPRIPILREAGFGDLPLYAPLSESYQREI